MNCHNLLLINYLSNNFIAFLKPFSKAGSPFDVSGIDINISKNEIVEYLREIRER
jgi:hypothetical protein